MSVSYRAEFQRQLFILVQGFELLVFYALLLVGSSDLLLQLLLLVHIGAAKTEAYVRSVVHLLALIRPILCSFLPCLLLLSSALCPSSVRSALLSEALRMPTDVQHICACSVQGPRNVCMQNLYVNVAVYLPYTLCGVGTCAVEECPVVTHNRNNFLGPSLPNAAQSSAQSAQSSAQSFTQLQYSLAYRLLRPSMGTVCTGVTKPWWGYVLVSHF